MRQAIVPSTPSRIITVSWTLGISSRPSGDDRAWVAPGAIRRQTPGYGLASGIAGLPAIPKSPPQKGCVGCHQAPIKGKERITAFSIVAAGWGPARQVHHRMLDRGVAWPHLSPADVSNLVAYLNSRNPTP